MPSVEVASGEAVALGEASLGVTDLQGVLPKLGCEGITDSQVGRLFGALKQTILREETCINRSHSCRITFEQLA